jgi:hypothetical protein
MTAVEIIIARMREEPNNIRFADLKIVCAAYVGPARQSGTRHLVYKTPWPGDPRVNIQNAGGQAKAYQVRQVPLAIDKLENGDVI